MTPERRLQTGEQTRNLTADLQKALRNWGVDTVVFDLDDTLIGTRGVFSQALQDVGVIFARASGNRAAASDITEEMLYPIIHALRPESGIHPTISEATVLICAKWLKLNPSSEAVQTALERVRDIYRKDVPEVFEGAIETVDIMNSTGARVVLVTHASPEWTWHKRIGTGLDGKFSNVYCLSVLRSKAVQWEGLLKREQLDPKHLLVIGDNKEGDILPAVQLGARGIWVTNGGRKPFSVEYAASHNPNLAIMEADSISEVPEVIIRTSHS